MVDGTAADAKSAAPNGKPTQLETLRPIFERLVGRTPTPDDNKEMLALVDLVKKTDAGFVLVSYMAETRARESREKVPAEVRAIVGEAEAKIRTATTDFERSLSKSVDAMLGAISDGHTAGPRPSQWRWPKQVAAVAAALVIMGALSFSGAVAQRAADSAVPIARNGPAGFVTRAVAVYGGSDRVRVVGAPIRRRARDRASHHRGARLSQERAGVSPTLAVSLRAVAALGISVVFVAMRWASPHLVVNSTPSMAIGLYWLTATGEVRRGDVVVACAPAQFGQWAFSNHILRNGRCDGVEPVLKRVVAVAGDRVQIDARGVFVAGRYMAGSKRDVLLDDGVRCGRRAPVAHVPDVDRVLRVGEVQLLGDRRVGSFDGRYWGATDRIVGEAVKIVAL